MTASLYAMRIKRQTKNALLWCLFAESPSEWTGRKLLINFYSPWFSFDRHCFWKGAGDEAHPGISSGDPPGHHHNHH